MAKEAETPGLTPRQNMTMFTCQHVSNNSVYNIQSSLRDFKRIKQLKGDYLDYIIHIIKNCLGAVDNNYEWCIMELDGTPRMNRKVKAAVTERIRKVEPISQIAIDLFNSFAALLPRT